MSERSYVTLPDPETSQPLTQHAMDPIPEVVDRTLETTASVDPQGLLRWAWHPPSPSTAAEEQPLGNDDHHVPFGAPPGYTRAERPEKNVTYSLSAGAPNTCLLVPSADSPNTRPRFHVTVAVRQGGTENGRFVAEFEIGHDQLKSKMADWITYGDLQRQPLLYVLHEQYYTTKDTRIKYSSGEFYWWFFKRPPETVQWRCYATAEETVKKQEEAKLYATYTPLKQVRHGIRVETLVLRQLEVTPEAHDFLDQILISLLILERRRLAPKFPG
ncbi:hypothetical protein D9758_004719 [Tetrapyrgos nigripes]|uniref:Uncharacterized protein n=1 Tax=Tetrapyrgos nigripes TaxID=182062 RepID=A0A8H5H0H5_9AGAR|nr:hypothetical protein D9758_004719 [Tetrapyrgos nigripes]